MVQAFSSAGLALLVRLRSYGLGYATMAVFAMGVAKAVGWLELERGRALQGDQSQRSCLVRPSRRGIIHDSLMVPGSAQPGKHQSQTGSMHGWCIV
ncbi:hypothetical protein BGZ61DRAFT_469972 [Ilyonectria robusta]|uniref:Uncharacterized protein n=1 Tax=Byssothecium circinans TaxID=147558 RepID=A0A6A5U8V7_9PLEO|nr:uncharacterized protein BGZ61DRAFT_469972 [Ilyonectria robusta]KAF1961315.1 hypothetical protein CC80DRAFT_235393 [Byssothecium circinans]KAH8646523.1 hypothetical protein BGZ61DRAFT_469972 [Ilyonectria robusta]